MNELTIDEYFKNREKYLTEGRSIEGKAAQQAAKENAYMEQVRKLRKEGLSLEEAGKSAEKWLKKKAALHNPDQIPGGNPLNIGGMGDKRLDSSIGSQWKYRINAVDEKIRELAKNMTEEEMKNTHLNVNLKH